MSVTKSKRVLIVLNYLSNSRGLSFYNGVEAMGNLIVNSILRSKYSKVIKLRDSRATRSQFLAKLKREGSKANVKAIDVIIILHGSKKYLSFYGNSRHSEQRVSVSTLKNQIKRLNLSNKLRLNYSLACYGRHHNKSFIQAGFSASIGANKVNTNATIEFPIYCKNWRRGKNLRTSLRRAERGYRVNDAIVGAFVSNVDSNKYYRGNGNLKIGSTP